MLVAALTFSAVAVDAATYTVTAGSGSDLINKFYSASAGDTILIPNGTYNVSGPLITQVSNLTIAGQGLPVIDFGYAESTASSVASGAGVDLSAHPIHHDVTSNPLSGIILWDDNCTVQNVEVKHSSNTGIWLISNDCLVKNSYTHNNFDTGIQIGGIGTSPSYNTVMNCDSHYNALADGNVSLKSLDGATNEGNADGFAAKLGVGPGNVFSGCRSYYNGDDGWDLYSNSNDGSVNNAVTISKCFAYGNGRFTNGSSSGGDGNGFKLGGPSVSSHTVQNCISALNGANGFDYNSSTASMTLINNTAYSNGQINGYGRNYRLSDSASTAGSYTLIKNLSVNNPSNGADKLAGLPTTGNVFESNSYGSGDFESTSAGAVSRSSSGNGLLYNSYLLPTSSSGLGGYGAYD